MDRYTPTDTPDDRDTLEAIGATYTKAAPQDRVIRELIARTFDPYLSTTMRGLQLGFAEGVDTRLLAPKVARLDVVEGSRAFYDAGRRSGLSIDISLRPVRDISRLPDAMMTPYYCLYPEHVQILSHCRNQPAGSCRQPPFHRGAKRPRYPVSWRCVRYRPVRLDRTYLRMATARL